MGHMGVFLCVAAWKTSVIFQFVRECFWRRRIPCFLRFMKHFEDLAEAREEKPSAERNRASSSLPDPSSLGFDIRAC